MKIIEIPIDVVLYRGTDLNLEKKYKKYIANWYTFNIIYSCMYVKKDNGAINMYNVISPLKLIDITATKLKDLSNEKNIIIGDLKISLRFLFSVIFGYGIDKNDSTFFKKDNLENKKYEGTQIYEFYKLTKEIGRGNKTINWFNTLKSNPPPSDNIVTDRLKFNRISDGVLDKIFLYELKRYKNLDGYYAPKIASNWSVVDCKGFGKTDIDFFESQCKFLQYEELAIFNTEKIKKIKTIKNNIIETCKNLNN